MSKVTLKKYLLYKPCRNCGYQKAVVRLHGDATVTIKCAACKASLSLVRIKP
jgi:predicted nucleic acid-binding Zn ribbon protein